MDNPESECRKKVPFGPRQLCLWCASIGLVQGHANLERLSESGQNAGRDELFEQVKYRAALGIPVSRACDQLGVPRSSYYAWLKERNSPAPSDGNGADMTTPGEQDARVSAAHLTAPREPGDPEAAESAAQQA